MVRVALLPTVDFEAVVMVVLPVVPLGSATALSNFADWYHW